MPLHSSGLVVKDYLRVASQPRSYLKVIKAMSPVKMPPVPGAFRFGPGFWDVAPWPKDHDVSAGPYTVTHAGEFFVPSVELSISTPGFAEGDSEGFRRALDKIADYEDYMVLPLIDAALDFYDRRLICPEGVDIYQYAIFAVHEYFYNRGKSISNIIRLSNGNVFIIGKKQEVGMFVVYREWEPKKVSSSECIFTSNIGMVVFGENVLGIMNPGNNNKER